jgi:hypothetical protein
MLLAAASALLPAKEMRWRETWPWFVGLAAFAGVYAAHILAVAGRVSPREGYGYWLQGGLDHLLATLQFLDLYFGARPLLVPLLVVVALVGTVGLWRKQRRLSAFLTAVIAGPLLAFLIFGNGGRELSTGETTGYWGILVVPIALSLVPIAIDRALVARGVRPRLEGV